MCFFSLISAREVQMKPIFFAQALGGCHYEVCVVVKHVATNLSPLDRSVGSSGQVRCVQVGLSVAPPSADRRDSKPPLDNDNEERKAAHTTHLNTKAAPNTPTPTIYRTQTKPDSYEDPPRRDYEPPKRGLSRLLGLHITRQETRRPEHVNRVSSSSPHLQLPPPLSRPLRRRCVSPLPAHR